MSHRNPILLVNATAPTGIYTLSLHDALPISLAAVKPRGPGLAVAHDRPLELLQQGVDRKSTRLNSSHLVISYAVFCLKKKILGNQSHPQPQGSDVEERRQAHDED